MLRQWTISVAALGLVLSVHGQPTPEASILDIEVQNRAAYYYQDFDVSKWGTAAGPVTPNPMRPFCPYVFLGDITAVNGKPAKGTYVMSTQMLSLRPDASTGQAIADVTRGGDRWRSRS